MKGYGELAQKLWEELQGIPDVNISLLIGPWTNPSYIKSYVEGEPRLKLWKDLANQSKIPLTYDDFINTLKSMKLPGYKLIFEASYRTKTRLIVGSGITGWEVPLVSLLEPFGVPWVPGSSLKGAMETTALNQLEEKLERGEASIGELVAKPSLLACKESSKESEGYCLWKYRELKLDQMKGDLKKIGILFGTKEFRGSMVVLGGFLEKAPKEGFLTIDVITPHYKRYYEGEEKWPHEHLDPVPLAFPAVREGTTFSFPLFIKEELDKSYEDYAKEVLHITLTRTGVGGKTSAGYGVFDRM
ncbi:MAG: type III-B CRISPR module RAMP protein Cmr6 [Candidatus Korarchaeum sp.]